VPVRFPTARSLFETFPEAAVKAAEAPIDAPSLDFLQNLAAGEKFDDAVTFCAYLLPRREAVWWACRCARALLADGAADGAPSKSAALLAAEAWVRNPDDEHREAALRIGSAGDVNDPMTWLAMAAGWAGGMFVSHPKNPVPAPQYMTPRACRIAVLLGARLVRGPERAARLRACIDDGAGLAEAGLP